MLIKLVQVGPDGVMQRSVVDVATDRLGRPRQDFVDGGSPVDDLSLAELLTQSFIAQLKEIAQASNEIANIVLLYFDTEDTATLNSEAFKKFLDRLSSIKSLDIPMKFALDFYEKFKDTHHEDEAWGEVERIMKEYQSCLQDLSSLLNDAHREMVDLIVKTRKAMKKYEV